MCGTPYDFIAVSYILTYRKVGFFGCQTYYLWGARIWGVRVWGLNAFAAVLVIFGRFKDIRLTLAKREPHPRDADMELGSPPTGVFSLSQTKRSHVLAPLVSLGPLSARLL